MEDVSGNIKPEVASAASHFLHGKASAKAKRQMNDRLRMGSAAPF